MRWGNVYFSFMNPSENVGAYAREYYRYYQFIMLLYPVYAILIDMVYADGDELICNLSYVIQIGINIPASVILCHKIGVGGASLGTLIGTGLSLAVLQVHFLRKQNSLKFVRHLCGRDIVKVARNGMMDSVVFLFWGITACVANKFILATFGEYYLPVLSVIISVIELTIIFDGIYLARMLGITDPKLLHLCQTAIRFACPFLVFSAILFLLTSYYLLIEKLLLAMVITVLKDCVVLISLMTLGECCLV